MANNILGRYSVIDEDAEIGKNVTIGSFVRIKSGTIIGDDCKIDDYVKFSGHCNIGKRSVIRYNATIARGVEIEEDVYISPNVMFINLKPDGTAQKRTLVKKGTFIGTAAVIGPDITIGEKAIIGAMAYVNKNVPDGATVVGIPARIISKK